MLKKVITAITGKNKTGPFTLLNKLSKLNVMKKIIFERVKCSLNMEYLNLQDLCIILQDIYVKTIFFTENFCEYVDS